MRWIKASERLPEKDAKYYCKHSITGVKMYIWKKEIYNDLLWLDENIDEGRYEKDPLMQYRHPDLEYIKSLRK